MDASDSRIQSLVHANGRLWATLDTAALLSTSSGTQVKAGVAFFVITPAVVPSISGRVVQQGVLVLADNNLTYGAVGVTDAGR